MFVPLDVSYTLLTSPQVTWLNDGIKALQVAAVLPNQGPLQVIKSIALNELKLMFTEATAYSPLTTSTSTDAAFTLPFAFPLDITALEQTITIGFNGVSIAQLALPKAATTTDVDARIIHLTFDGFVLNLTSFDASDSFPTKRPLRCL
jgi:hypothetical protein